MCKYCQVFDVFLLVLKKQHINNNKTIEKVCVSTCIVYAVVLLALIFIISQTGKYWYFLSLHIFIGHTLPYKLTDPGIQNGGGGGGGTGISELPFDSPSMSLFLLPNLLLFLCCPFSANCPCS